MLGLGEEVGGDPVGVVVAVGDDQDLGRAGDQVDADRAEDQPLGRGDVGIARSHDLGDRRDGGGAVGQRGDRLGAADPVDLVDAGQPGGDEDQRVDAAVRRRRDHDDALDAGDLGRHGVHQDGARIGRGAAGHVEADRIRSPSSGGRARRRAGRCSGRPPATGGDETPRCGRGRG